MTWADRAKCAAYGPHWLEFRTLEGKRRDCGECPVLKLCLAHAIETGATQVFQAGISIGMRPLDGLVEVEA